MFFRWCACRLLAGLFFLFWNGAAFGNFHLMQIEQIIGGVNGDTSAQAIQLRMKFSGQGVVSGAQLSVVDASGSNQIIVKDMTTNVANSALGARVLLTTTAFANYTSTPLTSDFAIDNPIPASYLAAGQLRFTDDFGTILWSVSWGGSGFTGSTTGSTTNDADGNFGPAFGSALPNTNLQALKFSGASNAGSTTNLADYGLSASPAIFINNAGTTFTVTSPPVVGDYDGNGTVDQADYNKWKQTFGNSITAGSGADGSKNGIVDAADYAVWRKHFAGGAGSGAGLGVGDLAATVPEPTALTSMLILLVGIMRPLRRRRS
jgi:hypothetical protein